jgi:putative ABC transport system ATP-binding protein
LLDTLSIEENIALPLSISNISTKKIQNEVKKIMQRLSIEDIASKFPMQVSGGQKQRCACTLVFFSTLRKTQRDLIFILIRLSLS